MGMRQWGKICPLGAFARTRAGTIVRQVRHLLHAQNLGAPNNLIIKISNILMQYF